MDFPLTYKEQLEAELQKNRIPTAYLTEAVRRMSLVYKEASGRGSRLVTKKEDVFAYAITRMPATYGAVSASFSYACDQLHPDALAGMQTVLDLGAGTGAASLAIRDLLVSRDIPIPASFTCVEREPEMRALGSHLTKTLPGIRWEQKEVLSALNAYAAENRTFDLVVASYMTNELPSEIRESLWTLLWRVTGKLLLITEPGTVVGSAILKHARTVFSELGASICAPCPAIISCPIAEDDWCHFTCRVSRSRLHKLLKGGDVPFEDEKFSFLALTRMPVIPISARVLRHPQKTAGKIALTLCTEHGIVQTIVTKKDKDVFTTARKAAAGDTVPIP